jgi:hypothetical protein
MGFMHIGLGKCATTTLQKHVFPQVAAQMGLRYMDLRDTPVRLLRAQLNTGLRVPLTHMQSQSLGDAFVSCEGLLGWDPFEWRARIMHLAESVPRETKILLTLRPPRAYFYSAYVQRTLHSGDIISPSAFFLDARRYNPALAHPVFSVERYNVATLIADLEASFATVEILKFEDILSGCILGHSFAILKVENKSLGQFSYNTLNSVQRALGAVGLSLLPAEAIRSQSDMAELAGHPRIKTRFPLRRVLRYLDNSGKIKAVNQVLDQYTAIFDREESTYAGLTSGGTCEPISS